MVPRKNQAAVLKNHNVKLIQKWGNGYAVYFNMPEADKSVGGYRTARLVVGKDKVVPSPDDANRFDIILGNMDDYRRVRYRMYGVEMDIFITNEEIVTNQDYFNHAKAA